MEVEKEYLFRSSSNEQVSAKQRPMFQVERQAGLSGDRLMELRLFDSWQPNHMKTQGACPMNALNDVLAFLMEGRAQHFMTIDQCLECAPQGINVERGPYAKFDW
ncbi:hypothetical protein X737_27545 [Mesorhizobium sp. L48C026A00]|nr:hypothetical protein X737_27545 [Mesorhizobium sp. L48C026A00]